MIDFSKLQRPRYPMPDFVKKALDKNNFMHKYKSRPAYQQNDYMLWINNAKKQSTKEKRMNQMLDELKRGNVYMKMKWKTKA